jgi:hypothetical protein
VEESYRRRLIRIVTFLAGVYFFLEFLLPASVLQAIGVADIHSDISNGFIVVGTMAFGLGIINLFRVHGTKVVFRRKDWLYSLALLMGLITMMTVTASDWVAGLHVTGENAEFRKLGLFSEVIVEDAKENREGAPPKSFRIEKLLEASEALLANAEQQQRQSAREIPSRLPDGDEGELAREQFSFILDGFSERLKETRMLSLRASESDEALLAFGKSLTATGVAFEKLLRFGYDLSTVKRFYLFFFEGLFVALGSAMFSLLGVYIASAAYRAFRIKSVESLLMMSAAILVMLGQIPFYEYISYQLPEIRQWLLEVPNTAAFRAIKIGAAIAGLVMAFRMWFSIESESFSSRGGRRS